MPPIVSKRFGVAKDMDSLRCLIQRWNRRTLGTRREFSSMLKDAHITLGLPIIRDCNLFTIILAPNEEEKKK